MENEELTEKDLEKYLGGASPEYLKSIQSSSDELTDEDLMNILAGHPDKKDVDVNLEHPEYYRQSQVEQDINNRSR